MLLVALIQSVCSAFYLSKSSNIDVDYCYGFSGEDSELELFIKDISEGIVLEWKYSEPKNGNKK